MSETTKIEWASQTFNPWIGCTKVSPGCANCYAEARDKRFAGGAHWGKGKARQRTSAGTWRNPVKWDATARELTGYTKPHPPRVFPSLCDWLDEEAPIEWLADFLKLIHDTPNLDWLLLTKRPENWNARIKRCIVECRESCEGRCWFLQEWLNGNPPANVWLGVSVEDQARAEERIPALLKMPARVRFLSVEPLLGAVSVERLMGLPCAHCGNADGEVGRCFCGLPTKSGIHWVIVGGESGPGARPCHVEWIKAILQQCRDAGVPCFVKQLGSNPHATGFFKDNKGIYLQHKKGGDPSEWPEELRVREFPEVTCIQ